MVALDGSRGCRSSGSSDAARAVVYHHGGALWMVLTTPLSIQSDHMQGDEDGAS